MTLASAGSAALAYRVTIDGCPSSPVTMYEMTLGVAPDGSFTRVDGLIMEGQKFTSQADPIACKLAVGGLTIKCADIGGAWSVVFDQAPTLTTWLAADTTAVATSITVDSTTGWPSAGFLWIDFECIYYTSTDATHFLGCTRGALSDNADAPTYHYITDGARLRNPEITNWPVLWEGRRVRVYRYEETDSLTGDGTQVYLGVIATSPRFDGSTWSIGVDSIASILDQMLGADLSEAAYPRGVYYPATSPISFLIRQHDAASVGSAQTVANTTATVTLSGFFADNAAFCTTLTASIVTALGTAAAANITNTAIRAVPFGQAWRLEATTLGGGSERAISIAGNLFRGDNRCSVVDGAINPLPGNEVGSTVTLVAPTQTYYYFLQSTAAVVGAGTSDSITASPDGIGTVPRGAFSVGSTDPTMRIIYLGGASPISGLMTAVQINWPITVGYGAASEGGTIGYHSPTVTQATRSLSFAQDTHEITGPGGSASLSGSLHAFTSAALPEIRFGMRLCTQPLGSSTSNFLATIVASQQQYSTLGVMPMFRAGDYDATAWTAMATTGQPPLVTRRYYSTFGPISIGDILRPELQMAGCFLCIDSTGRLVPKRVRLAVGSELSATATIDQSTLLTDRMLLSHEVGGLGQVNQVMLRTGYNPKDDEYTGQTFITRDVAAFGQSPSVRQMAVEPKSEYKGPPIKEEDVIQMATPFFGAFAGSYSVDTIDCAAHDDVQLGDPIIYDNPHQPDETGAIGVTGKVALVTGRTTEAYSPRVTLATLATKQKLGGYAPSAKITFWTLVSGNTYDLLLGATGSGMFPTGTSCTSWFAVGDRVKKVTFNNAAGAEIAGTVTVVSSTTVTVTFDSATGTPDAYLTMADSTDANFATLQRRFTSIAGSTGVVDYASSDQPAFRIGP